MFSTNVKIPPYTGDVNSKISLSHLFDYLINIGTLHVEAIGLPTDELLKRNITWMIYQAKIIIHDLPVIDSEVTLTTWVSDIEKIKIYRQVKITDQDGKVLVEASFIWLLVDIEKMRVMRPIKEIKDLVENVDKALDNDFTSFKSMEDFDRKVSMPIYKSDIDYNKHVHSGTYLRWVTDLVDLDNDKLREVDIYFKDSVLKEDQVEILEVKEGPSYIHQINKNGQGAVFAKTFWEEN